MTKQLLLAAASAVAIGFSGAAVASEISGATVSGVALTPGTKAYTVASEVITSTAANLTTTSATTVSAKLDGTARFEPGITGTNYAATLTLTGAKFQAPVTSVTVNGGAGNCAATPATVVSGGGAGQSTVTVVFNVSATCSVTNPVDYTPNGVTFGVPFVVDASASTVSASVGFQVAATAAAYGGANGTATLVQKASGYAVSLAANTAKPTTLSLSSTPVYSALLTTSDYDNIIGDASADFATPGASTTGSIYADLAAGALPPVQYGLSLSGTFGTVKPQLDGTTNLTTTSPFTTASIAAQTGAHTITVAIPTPATVSGPQSYTATLTPSFATASTVVTAPAAVSNVALQTIGLQGTSFVAPWVQSTNANYNTVLRVSNHGGTAGAVTLTLLSPSATPDRTTCTATELSKLSGIASGAELSINSADLTTCFGAFGRGDVRISIQSQSTNLTAKLRIVNPGNVVSEQSLGAITPGITSTN